ncbi:hypothetical protein G7Y89_g5621 [Cudoniella acicularis]|uniref:Uncharacterized protein n=1 Tax=Cudoniella acicularis TaxID=354080 RepID=A0A8H4RMX9_9HELO|nr:hypothetical protein G7Y89_g5621 [Cudoniella acicularis]
MFRSLLFSISVLIWTLCVLPIQGSWFPHTCHSTKRPRSPDKGSLRNVQGVERDLSSSVDSSSYYMVITTTIPTYEICSRNTIESNTTSCSTAFTTITTTCSIVLEGLFTAITVSDCDQIITFSSQNDYSITTTTGNPTPTPALKNRDASIQSPSPTTYIQDIVSYYLAPWQSLAAQALPPNITVLICKNDNTDTQMCETIHEVWVVVASELAVTQTSTLLVSTSLVLPGILLPGANNSPLSLSPGNFNISTELTYTTQSTYTTTSTSIIGAEFRAAEAFAPNPNPLTSTTTRTTTVTLTGKATTVTRTLKYASVFQTQVPQGGEEGHDAVGATPDQILTFTESDGSDGLTTIITTYSTVTITSTVDVRSAEQSTI